MNIFKNDKKKEEIVVELPDKIDLKDLVKTDVDNKNDVQKALLAEAVELFSKMLKGYPVTDKAKVWIEAASKEL